jgi:hypothetical protein
MDKAACAFRFNKYIKNLSFPIRFADGIWWVLVCDVVQIQSLP